MGLAALFFEIFSNEKFWWGSRPIWVTHWQEFEISSKKWRFEIFGTSNMSTLKQSLHKSNYSAQEAVWSGSQHSRVHGMCVIVTDSHTMFQIIWDQENWNTKLSRNFNTKLSRGLPYDQVTMQPYSRRTG